jgi:translation initiation factor IF-1
LIAHRQLGPYIRVKIGDRVKLIAKTLAWNAEMALQDKIGEVIERRDDRRVSIRCDNGKLLMGRAAEPFELVSSLG